MRIYCDSDAPALDRGVERRLREIDKNLVVTWSKFAIDAAPGPRQTYPIDDKRGRPIPANPPRYHLWALDSDGLPHLIGAWSSFDGRHIKWLEENAYDTQNRALGERMRLKMKHEEEKRERELAARRDDKQHWLRENRGRLDDSLFNGKHHRRDAKIFSSKYVKYRGTATEQVRKTHREDGWTPSPWADDSE